MNLSIRAVESSGCLYTTPIVTGFLLIRFSLITGEYNKTQKGSNITRKIETPGELKTLRKPLGDVLLSEKND